MIKRIANSRTTLLSGALHGLLSVILGAFAAHGLSRLLPPRRLELFHTGVEYQASHALALLLVGLLAWFHESPWLRRCALLLNLGILLFSGSLYLLALTGQRQLGFITPLGGVSLVLGWMALLTALARLPERPCP